MRPWAQFPKQSQAPENKQTNKNTSKTLLEKIAGSVET
jgi:hypothetical protein